MMKTFVAFLALVALVRSESAPSFEWIDATHLKVKFDNYEDTLVLRYHNPIPQQEGETEITQCTFLGELEKDSASSAAVIGCMGDETFEVTLHSSHHTQSRFLVKNNAAEIIENPYKNSDSLVHNLENLVKGSYSDGKKALPETMTMNFFLNYDFNFNKYTQDQGGPIDYLRKVMTSSQADYYHPTLTTKITLVVGENNFKYYPNEDWRANQDDIYYVRKFNQNDPKIHANAYFAKDLESDFGVIGIGFVGVSCGPTTNRATINELRPTVSETAHVLSHETGHNLGMHHDFDHHEQKCTGIMDYGNPPNVWSQCSVDDFTKYYNSVSQWCM